MPRYTALCSFSDTSIGQQTIEVNAATQAGAEKMLKKVYGARSVANIREVRSNNSSGDSNDASGLLALGLLGGAAWAFVTFTPWILMLGGGIVATWLAQLMVGESLESSIDRDKGGKVTFIFALALLAGGIGFVKGVDIQNHFNTPEPTQQEQVKK